MSRTRAVLAVLLLALAPGCQDEQARIVEHAARGQEYLDAEAYDEAVLEFKSVLQLDPNHAEAHYGLAKTYLASKRPRDAYWELEDVVRLDPGNADARLQLAQFLVLGKPGEVERAIENADAVLADDPGRWEAWVIKGQALKGLDRLEEAEEAYRSATEQADVGAPLIVYANFLRGEGKLGEAEAQFRRLLELEPGFNGHAALGGFLASDPAREDEAEAHLREALELADASQRKAAYTLLVNFLVARQRFDEAELALQGAIEEVPGDRDLLYSLAQFYTALGRIAEADALIEEATTSSPDDPRPLLLLSAYRGLHGDLEGALEAAEKAVAIAPENEDARLRRAEVLIDLGFRANQAGDAEEGRALLARGQAGVDALLATDPASYKALFVRGKLALAERRPADAVADLRTVIDMRPDMAQGHFVLASANYMQGDRPAARRNVVRALELEPNLVEARRLLARLHGELGDQRLAVQEGQRVLEQRPGDAETRVIVAQALVRQRSFDAALAVFDEIPEEEWGADVHFAIGRTHQFKGELEQARAAIDRAWALRPDHVEILRALVELDLRSGALDESVGRVQAAAERAPESPHLQVLLGEIAMFSGDAQGAESAFRRALDLDPNLLAAYQRLASLYVATGRTEEVLTTYEQALERNDRSARLHLDLALLYEMNGRLDEAMDRYDSAIALDPDLAVAKNNLAYLLAEQGTRLDRALDLAQSAKEALPGNGNVADTYGWVLLKKGVPDAAVGYLREAVGAFDPDDPNLPIVRYHLALAFEADGRPGEALQALEQASAEADARMERLPPGGKPPAWVEDIRKALARLRDA